jgi:MFS family permease
VSKTSEAGAADPAAATESDAPVTYRVLFAHREFRALYASLVISWLGDYLSRAAVTVLVYERTHSTLLAGSALAVSFLPWILSGTVFSALAERYPYRRVMIVTDVARMALVALLLVPGMPVAGLLVLIFTANLVAPPAQAARSALVPHVVGRRALGLALAINASSSQALQVFGYVVGATIATAISPRIGLAVDVVSFGASALLLTVFVRPRPATRSKEGRRNLLRETSEGIAVVFRRRELRLITLVVWLLSLAVIAPEGLAAGWAAEFTQDATRRGFDQGLLMAAGPVGWVIGGVLLSRVLSPDRHDRLMRPMLVLAVASLIPVLFAPPVLASAGLVLISGVCQGGVMPKLNAQFVLILPDGYRARAFGVVQAGLQFANFAGIALPGLFTGWLSVPVVVGLWAVLGLLLMLLMIVRWPSPGQFRAAAAANATNLDAGEARSEPRPPVATVTPETS